MLRPQAQELTLRDRFTDAAKALFGEKWRSRTAVFLGMARDSRTVRRWRNGQEEVPLWAVERLEFERARRRLDVEAAFGVRHQAEQTTSPTGEGGSDA